MARAGLGPMWACRFANDFDRKKAASYAAHWGAEHLKIGEVGQLTAAELPGFVDLAWASFPCQDLSLAGAGAGLEGERSATFWPFWRLITALDDEGRAPRLVALENVCGALTSRNGADFAAIGAALVERDFRFGAVVIDAVHFVPQSRPRLFIIAVHPSTSMPDTLIADSPDPLWHPPALIEAHGKLAKGVRQNWMWLRLPGPPLRNMTFADIIEDDPKGVAWHRPEETNRLLSLMSAINLAKVAAAKKTGRRMIGGVYRRTRTDVYGARVQRAEVRFDGIAGCLRTPAGGSSRQTIMLVEGSDVRSRLLSPREAARLMGLPEDYDLPSNYNEAYHLVGDGLAVPVVGFLATHLLEPILAFANARRKAA